ncbi:MAG: hypothetical protein IJK97_11765 [Thermoguttaceae bacterium]|nr:hypothetical protein [Thermoguttaceae bacterium]MBR0192914.1 hypothetical protein [Thermoguttaceae bacterium]
MKIFLRKSRGFRGLDSFDLLRGKRKGVGQKKHTPEPVSQPEREWESENQKEKDFSLDGFGIIKG